MKNVFIHLILKNVKCSLKKSSCDLLLLLHPPFHNDILPTFFFFSLSVSFTFHNIFGVYLEAYPLDGCPASEGDLRGNGGRDPAVVVQRLLAARRHAAPGEVSIEDS